MEVESKGYLTSVPIGNDNLRINYLFFEDENLLFCKANSLEWSNLIHILNPYETSSNQFLNKEKTSIFFSANTPRDIQQNIIKIVGVKSTSNLEKCLGIPAFLGKKNQVLFSILLTKLEVEFLIGKPSFSLFLEKKFFSRQSSNLSPPTP